ncbi:Signal transduction histidine kinase [Alteromonadaceae bacterium Bs31]|nr:Signal transduction histidine kinase [Alteromonadaceae bacterium Bs31]
MELSFLLRPTNNMTEKVLIIEDTRSFSRILSTLIFETHGFQCDVAEDYASAKEILMHSREDYFVAIVDLHLPDAPEGEAVELVTERDLPALVFTATGDRATEEDLWSRGIADYAHKSGKFSLEYVVWAVRRIYLNRHVEVLVVDDSRASRLATEKLLHVQNYQIHTAGSGKDALECIQQHPNISIAVIDCFMEGLDGLQLTSALRDIKSSSELEIIGVSGQEGLALSAQFIKAGANDFLPKPFLPEELLCRINRGADRIEAFINQKKLNEDKNRILGTAAHDIRGPLAAMKTAAGLIRHQNVDNKRVNTMASMIEKNSLGLIELLESLLDVSAIESGKSELNLSELDLTELLRERADLYNDEALNKGIELNLALTDSICTQLDDVKIKQVIDNLISNAIKYSPKNAKVDINLKRDGNTALICVADQGQGIAKEEQGKLFKAFSVLSTRATGGEKQTGLGLAITKNIVEAHQGKLYYKARTGGGSQFFIELPLT